MPCAPHRGLQHEAGPAESALVAGEPFSVLLGRADAALCQAKCAGRNRVQLAEAAQSARMEASRSDETGRKAVMPVGEHLCG
jgi:hypothetical protein